MTYAVNFETTPRVIAVKLSTGGMMHTSFGSVQYVNTGKQGIDGTTFYPSVEGDECTLSWTNDGNKVKAYVMENGQMVEKELFEKIKDDGKPHFPKSQTFHMCADMQRMASAILQKCNSADGRYFETEYEERLKDLDEVIVLCDTLNQYINLSYKRKYISGDQCHYWAELVRPVRQKAFNWKRNDSNRAAALREAKANQELAKMGQMAQQIAEALARNP